MSITIDTHLAASKYIQGIYTLPEIHRRWNASGLGNECVIGTVKRWCNNGPDTKNPRFEPWLREWAETEWYQREMPQLTLEDVLATVDLLNSQLEMLREQRAA